MDKEQIREQVRQQLKKSVAKQEHHANEKTQEFLDKKSGTQVKSP